MASKKDSAVCFNDDENNTVTLEQADTDFSETFERETVDDALSYIHDKDRLRKTYLTFGAEERKTFRKICDEYLATGESETYERIWLEDWRETPVDIDTFIEEPRYLGGTNDEGKSVYPFWREQYRKIFSGENFGKYTEIAITGAIGIGKTSFVATAMAYLLYRLMCLRNPQAYYGFKKLSIISLAFLNINLILAQGVGYRELHDILIDSPWFLKHGRVSKGTVRPLYIPPKGIEITPGSLGRHFLGKQVYAAFLDEVNFGENSIKLDRGLEKNKMMLTYSTVSNRITSRFIRGGTVLGKAFLVSSKRAENDFLEQYIAETREKGKISGMYIIDEPQWTVLPSWKYSTDENGKLKTFTIAVGNRHLQGFVVDKEKENDREYLDKLLEEGYYFLHPPISMEPKFVSSFNTALMDLAGVSVVGLTSFFSYEMLDSCYEFAKDKDGNIIKEHFKGVALWNNPVGFEFINRETAIPMGRKTADNLKDYFKKGWLQPGVAKLPWYIHLDLSITGDRTGISCVADAGPIYDKEIQTSKNHYVHVFSMSICAPPGDRISQNKILEFIFWLRDGGFRIKEVSADAIHLSESLRETLERNNITSVYRSVDRKPDAYKNLHTVMSSGCIKLLRIPLLEEELTKLQHDITKDHFNHPKEFSKDMSDSLAGAVWGAVLGSKNHGTQIQSIEDLELAVSGITPIGANSHSSIISEFGLGGVFALTESFKTINY